MRTKTRAYMCLVGHPMDKAEALRECEAQARLLYRWAATDRFCVGLKVWRDGYQVWLYEYIGESHAVLVQPPA